MKQIITTLLLLGSLAACSQPVTRVRLIALQNPPDTTLQYFIQGGGGRDTIKWVPIDSLTSLVSVENIYNTSDTLTSDRVLGTGTHTLTMSSDSVASNQTILVLQSGYDSEVYHYPLIIASGPNGGPRTDSLYFATFDGDIDVISASKEGITYGGVYTYWYQNNSLVHKAYVDSLVSGVSEWESGYAEAYYNGGGSTQSIANTFTVLTPMSGGDLATGWSWSTSNDRFTYSGSSADRYLVQFSLAAHCSTTTFDEITVSVRENSTETTAVGQIECDDTGVTESTSGSAIVTANNGDTFDLGAKWTTAASSNISIKYLTLTMIKL